MPDPRSIGGVSDAAAPAAPVTATPPPRAAPAGQAAPAAPPAPAAPATATPPPGRVLTLVYEDEHVRMEWSARTPAADTIAVTFDPILVDSSQPAYAAGFLHKAGIDTLCVRKKSEHFYQPLTRACFDAAAAPVLARYRRRLAYGSSLGAYAVLYFCAHGFETVISSSPRVSAHPRFGRPHWQERAPFLHEPFDADHPATSGAVVFYDPHDEMDRRFVDEGLRPAWPQARFVAVPYAGHPSNQFLSEIGYIAPFVQAVVAGKPPPALDRRGNKARSFTYRHVLAAACLRHHKPRWAESLCRQALQMKPDLVGVKLTLGQALLALGRLDEAETPLIEFQLKYPQDGDARQALRALARQRAPLAPAHALPRAAEHFRRLESRARDASRGWRFRLAMTSLWLTSRLRLTVSREDIDWCYRHLLGRAPESDRALLAHRGCAGFEPLVRAFVRSPEYAAADARSPAAADLERLVRTAVLVRRTLPVGGRMVDVRSAGLFSQAVCERIDSRPSTDALPGPAPGVEHGDGARQYDTTSFDLALNTETVALTTADAAALVQRMTGLVKPGGHALLATRSSCDADSHRDGASLSAEDLLQAQGLTVIESFVVGDADDPRSNTRTQLTLARKPLPGTATQPTRSANG